MFGRLGCRARIVVGTMSAAGCLAAWTAAGEAAGGRQSMEQCVDRVLSRLTRAGAADAQVGPAVLSACDGPLRLVLADAIASGEAPGFCRAALCLDLARSRAAQEATAEYRRRIGAAPSRFTSR